MPMVSLKLSKKKAKEQNGGPVEASMPEYPYGTRLDIEGDKIDALGLEDCAVGDKLTFTIRVEVIGIRENKRQDREDDHEVELQITDIETEDDEDDDKEDKSGARLNELAGHREA